MDDAEIKKLLERCFLELQAGKPSDSVKAELVQAGLSVEAAEYLVRQSETNLSRYRAYKSQANLDGTTSTIVLGIGALAVGYILSQFSADAPGRFSGLYLTFYLVGFASIAYGLYCKVTADR